MGVLRTLLEITVYSAVIFAAIMLLKKIFNSRMSPRLHCAVWALLIVRLLLPFTIDSGLRLFVIPQENTRAQQISNPVSEKTDNIMEQMDGIDTSYIDSDDKPAAPAEAGDAFARTEREAEPDIAAPAWELSDILLAVWIAGAGAALVYIAYSYLALRQRVRRGAVPAGKRLLSLFEQCKRELGIKRNVRVLGVYNIGTPALFIPSTVLIPAGLLLSADDTQITYALKHELTHYRRGDHIVCALLVLLQAVYWFNPFVWLAFGQIRLDIEVACDSGVVKALDKVEKSRYANMIVSMFAVTHGQMALGMARGNAKRAAEKRVRGIFTDGRSRRSSKLVSVVLAAVLLVTCFTTACQPTPEEPVVAPRSETYQERETPPAKPDVSADTLTREDLGIPDHVSESYDLGEKLTLNIDADVKTGSDLASYKVYSGALTGFTQQQADHFADMFVDGVSMTAYDDRYTKEEITEYFLLPAQKTLSELESGTYVKDPNMDGDTPTVESMKEAVEMYEQWIVDAPEQRSSDTITIDSYAASNNYFYGEFPIEGSKITGKFMVGSGDRNRSGGFNFYNSSYDLMEPHNISPDPLDMALPEGGLDLRTTPQQAVDMATQIKNDLGADELDLYAVLQAQAWVEEMGTGMINAYYIVFTRHFDDVPVLYVRYPTASNQLASPQAFEKLIITIDDSGVIAVNWMGNTEITGVLNEKPQFIGFDKALGAARKQIDETYRYWAEQDKFCEHVTLDINYVSLEYLRTKEPNGGDNDVRFVPAWVFNGAITTRYTESAMQEIGITEKEMSYSPNNPIVVNALDGSAFNPMFSDGIEPPMDTPGAFKG